MLPQGEGIEEEIGKLEDGTYSTLLCNDETIPTSAKEATLTQKFLTEVVATFLLMFFGGGAVVVDKTYHTLTFLGVCTTWGLLVMVLIYSTGHISGAHFNPAVTITLTIFRRFPVVQLPIYLAAQFLGAIFGSGLVVLLLNPEPECFFGTNPAGSDLQSFITEIISSFLLIFVVSAMSDARAIGELSGVVVGATICLLSLMAGPVSGASMNPARTIGPAVVMSNYKAIWVYFVGPIFGMIVGVIVYNRIKVTGRSVQYATETKEFLKAGLVNNQK